MHGVLHRPCKLCVKSLSVMHVGNWFIRFGKLYLMPRFANECFTLETCNRCYAKFIKGNKFCNVSEIQLSKSQKWKRHIVLLSLCAGMTN